MSLLVKGVTKHSELTDVSTPHVLADLVAAVCSQAEAAGFIDIHETGAKHRWTADKLRKGAGPDANPTEIDVPVGVETLLGLTDTPASYEGQARMVLRVKSDESAAEFGLPKLDITKFFDGGIDTPEDKAWQFESPMPFEGTLYFSPIVKNIYDQPEVYVIDTATNFWKYNLKTKNWTKLASPTYGADSGDRSLALSPDGKKLACISDILGEGNFRGAHRIEIYTIASDSWVASPQNPDVNAATSVIAGLVWQDDDTIWAWASQATTGTKTWCKCIKYTPSTTTWEQFETLHSGLTYCQPGGAGILADNTVVFGGYIGESGKYSKYTIASDSYTLGSRTGDFGFANAADRNKLWLWNGSTYRQGYILLSDETQHNDVFPENPDRVGSYLKSFGVNDDADSIIARARADPPEVMSCVGAGMWMLIELVATNWTLVVVDKPNDGYDITYLADSLYGVAERYGTILLEAASWKFYYPKAGDYALIKLYSCPLEGGA